MNFVKQFTDKRILLLGFAREGVSSYRFIKRHFPGSKIGIFDQKNHTDLQKEAKKIIKQDKELKIYLGEKSWKKLSSIAGAFDVIIKTAGIPNKFIPKKIISKLTTQTEIFFANFKGIIVGVTGTKGKSTTASLIYKMLKASGKKAKLIGNIGFPSLDFLDGSDCETICVMEISSHQLAVLKQSPHVAVILNIYPEHLDYYRNMSEYIRAKANITKYQNGNDYLVYNEDDWLVESIAERSPAQKIPFGKHQLYEITNWKTNILGRENQLNILAAKRTAEILGLSQAAMKKAVSGFKPLPHRLELVGTFKGIIFYNDSLATIPEATRHALESLGRKAQTLICGGFDRGLEFKVAAKTISDTSIKNLVLFPTTGEKIWQEILKINPDAGKKYRHLFTAKMSEAVKFAYEHTGRGSICLLSNASPSFGIFKDYRDRGNQFKRWVKLLGK